jgi:hypothetical protein
MDGGYPIEFREAGEVSDDRSQVMDDEDPLGAIRGIMFAFAFEAALGVLGWGAWRLIFG